MQHKIRLVGIFAAFAGLLWLLSEMAAEPSGFLTNKHAEFEVFSLNDTPLGSVLLYLESKPILSDPMVFSVYFDLNRDGVFDPTEELGVDAVPAFAEPDLPTGFPVDFGQSADPAGQLQALLSGKQHVPIRVVLSTFNNPGTPVEIDDISAKRTETDVGDIFSPQGSLIGASPIPRPVRSLGPLAAFKQWFTMPTVYAPQQQQPPFRPSVPDLNPRKGKQNECVSDRLRQFAPLAVDAKEFHRQPAGDGRRADR